MREVRIRHNVTKAVSQGRRKTDIAREMGWKPQELDDAFTLGTFPSTTVQLISTGAKALTIAQGSMLVAYSRLPYGQARTLFLLGTVTPRWEA